METSFVAFLAVAVVVIVTPGQDTALTIRNTLSGGRRLGFGTAIGVATGQACWTLAASVGVTAILVASEAAFQAIRLVGAGYLIWLGLRSIAAAIGGMPGHRVAGVAPWRRAGHRSGWRQGLLSSLGNPKLAVFFSSLLPPFVPAGASPFVAMLALGAVFASLTLAWLLGYTLVVDRLGDRLRGGPVRRAFDAMMGAVLVFFGARLAVERR
jgi:threonine/homoserine/homoserine lactone efflux protein